MRKVRRSAKGFLRVKMKRFVAIVICLIVILFLAMQCYINMLQCSGCYDNKNNQTMVDKIASNIQIQYQIIDNKEGCTQKIIIINKGCENITADEDWAIYFYSFGLIEATLYPYPGGLLFRTPGLRIHHLSGYLYKITPDKEKFENLVLNANISIQFKSRNFISTKTDVLPNWYVSAKNIPPKIIVSTLESKFKTSILVVNASSMMRYANDMTRKLSVEDRYELNDKYVIDIGRAPNIVIPTPYNTSIENDVYLVVSSNWVVLESKHFINEVKYLSGQLSIPQRNIRPGHSYVQFIKLKSNISFTHKTSHKTNLLAESYELTVDPGLKRITIKSFTNAGAFYAIQSLLSVGRNEDGKFIIPKLTIKDQPRFGYRGFHLDVARNFRKKSEVLKILNIMAMYKLNKFHFHLTDDEGWRLEIPGLLELTQIGAYRCHSNDETECLSPQLGSGPFKESSGSGYYSVRDYQDILKHANKLHIQVIPEFDMPGHARAAIKSMEYRYKKLKEDNVTAAGEFLLTELGDQSVYKTIQAFTDNAVNPCIESTYTFIRHLVGEVKRMHESIQPLQYFHYGGDEVPAGAWENSTACTSLLKIFKDFKTVKDLKKNFIRRVLSILQSEDLIAGAWEDGLAVDKKQLNRSSISFPGDIYAYAWNNVWQDRKSHTAHNLANDGYKVILAHATHFYFDHPYEADFDERGLSWATRQITVRDVFNYMPLNLFGNAEITMANQPVQEWMLANITLQKPQNIVGMQAQLWSETVRTESDMDFMLFPRLIAYAERAWHQAEWEKTKNKPVRHYDWMMFSNTLGYRELRKLDKLKIGYRIPPPGAVVKRGQLLVNTDIPGLTVQYSVDGIRWGKVGPVEMVPDDKKILLRTCSTDGKRYSRIVTWFPKHKPQSLESADDVMLETVDKSNENFMLALYPP